MPAAIYANAARLHPNKYLMALTFLDAAAADVVDDVRQAL